MGWFSGVPVELNIAGSRFRLADEAIEEQQQDLNPFDDLLRENGERPERDWAASALLHLARVQLDEMIQILVTHLELPVEKLSGAEVTRRLTVMAEEAGLPEQRLLYEVCCVGEGVDLWRALGRVGEAPVSHAFAVDGSISFTVGPDLPELGALGLKASVGGELEATPLDVFSRASSCTRDAAEVSVVIAERRRRNARHAALVRQAQSRYEFKRDLHAAAYRHFSIWSLGSERSLVRWLIEFLDAAGLLPLENDGDRARSTARLMGLWALHLELAAYSGEGMPGDWRHEASVWIEEGFSCDQLFLLNSADDLGLAVASDGDIPAGEGSAAIIDHYYRDVVKALISELGHAFTFAYFWASRFDGIEYPVAAEFVGQIVNDPAVLADDPENKVPTYNWVQSGMYL
jgi:hypothetical protein